MTRPRIVFLNRYFHPDQSATSRLLTDLAAHLADGAEVTVLCSRQLLDDPEARLPSRAALGRVRIRRLWSTRWGRHWLPGRALDYLSFLASAGIWLLLRLRHGDIAIAKTDPPFLGTVTAVAAAIRGAHLVNWMQDVFPETAWRLGVGAEHSLAGRVLRGLRNWALRRAALNVAISPGMAEQVAPQAGRPLTVIPNWADDLAEPGPINLRAQLGLEGGLVVGYSGNLGRAHPVEPLLKLSHAVRDDPSLRFLISGGGVNLERLKHHVHAAGIGNWTFLPYQPGERLAALLQVPDVHLTLLDPRLERLILPSKVYGVLSAGRPILHIGDPGGEVAVLLAEHRCGWAVAADDQEGLVTLLRHLATVPQERLAAGHNARRAFEQHFSRPRALERWERALALVGTARAAET